MAFLLRAASPLLSSIGLGSVGRAAKTVTDPLLSAANGIFGTMKNVAGSLFGGISGAARTAANVVTSPFRMLSSPFFMISALAVGGLVVYTITSR